MKKAWNGASRRRPLQTHIENEIREDLYRRTSLPHHFGDEKRGVFNTPRAENGAKKHTYNKNEIRQDFYTLEKPPSPLFIREKAAYFVSTLIIKLCVFGLRE